MKRVYLIMALASFALAACTKKTTNIIIEPKPSYIVSGIHDISIKNGPSYPYSVAMPIDVEYYDSAQQAVTLSLSALPAGITMDTTWITSGIPTFSTVLYLYDTTAAGATPGNYSMTLTATGASYGKKTFTFILKVLAQPSCTSTIIGAYTHCSGCSAGYYTDNVTADATITNKIWFSNFNNSGASVYGTVNCTSGTFTIPSQTVSGVIYHGNGYIYGAHYLSGSFYSGSSYCSVTMNL